MTGARMLCIGRQRPKAWCYEDVATGNRRAAVHVSHAEANMALLEAQQFLEAIRFLLPVDIVDGAAEREAHPEAREQEQ